VNALAAVAVHVETEDLLPSREIRWRCRERRVDERRLRRIVQLKMDQLHAGAVGVHVVVAEKLVVVQVEVVVHELDEEVDVLGIGAKSMRPDRHRHAVRRRDVLIVAHLWGDVRVGR
jgi:hypothetical protein